MTSKLIIKQHALQSLPRQDRRHLQRNQVRRRCHSLQAGRQPVHGEARQRADRTHQALALPRGVLDACQGECGEAEEGEGGGHDGASEAAAGDAEGGEDGERKG